MSNKSNVPNENKEFTHKNMIVSSGKAMIIKSPEPLPNEMLKFKRLYIVCLVCIVMGLLFETLLAVGILGLMLVYIIDYHMVKIKRKVLRTIKFQFVEGVGNDDIFITVQPVFTSKYNILVEKNEEGSMMLTHNNHIYDILINDDNTFTIWWRMSLGKAFLSFNKYKSYRRILASMGIIAYEIQNAYHIQ